MPAVPSTGNTTYNAAVKSMGMVFDSASFSSFVGAVSPLLANPKMLAALHNSPPLLLASFVPAQELLSLQLPTKGGSTNSQATSETYSVRSIFSSLNPVQLFALTVVVASVVFAATIIVAPVAGVAFAASGYALGADGLLTLGLGAGTVEVVNVAESVLATAEFWKDFNEAEGTYHAAKCSTTPGGPGCSRVAPPLVVARP